MCGSHSVDGNHLENSLRERDMWLDCKVWKPYRNYEYYQCTSRKICIAAEVWTGYLSRLHTVNFETGVFVIDAESQRGTPLVARQNKDLGTILRKCLDQ